MVELSALSIVKIIEDGYRCIWGSENSICFYNPYNPPIYFSLGDALTAVGLLFAVIQLISPIKKVTLAIKGFRDKVLWILIGIAMAFILVATNAPQLQEYNLPHPLSYALFWEILGFSLFLSSVVWFWFQASKFKNIFKKNSHRFFHTILREVANGKDGYLEACITILNSNLEQVVDAVKQNEDNQHKRNATSLLNYVLSEKEVLNYIVSSRIDFLFNLIVLIKEKQVSNDDVGFVISKIIQELYNNPISYLYKQLDDSSGVSLYASLYEEIFKEDSSFIREFRVLKDWHPYSVSGDVLLNDSYIDVFLKSIKKVADLDGFSDSQISDLISSSLYELETFTQRATWASNDPNKWFGSRVGSFLGRTFADLYDKAVKNKTINEYEYSYIMGVKKYQQNITASYAQAIVDHLRVLASFKDKSMERTYAMGATERVLSIHSGDNSFTNVRSYFLEYIWEKIEENVVRGYFPAVLRIYIEIMYWNGATLPEWRKNERKKLIKYLYSELAPRIEKKELMADYKTLKEEVLLPDFIKFTNKKFWIIGGDGSKTELKP